MEGTVSECSGANIFFVRNGRVCTNDATSSILPGITRGSVLELCKREGIATEVRTFAPAELLEADEVFITGTAAEVTPVRAVDAVTFTTGDGTLTRRLQERYREVVTGGVPELASWLHWVRE
jgi:branched-chain amino acid aminotransferase